MNRRTFIGFVAAMFVPFSRRNTAKVRFVYSTDYPLTDSELIGVYEAVKISHDCKPGDRITAYTDAEWHSSFRDAIGTVNDSNWSGHEPGTVMYVGYYGKRWKDIDGSFQWRSKHEFLVVKPDKSYPTKRNGWSMFTFAKKPMKLTYRRGIHLKCERMAKYEGSGSIVVQPDRPIRVRRIPRKA